MKHTLIIAGVLAQLAGIGIAGGVNYNQVSADAAWIVHLDFDAFRATQIGQLVGAEVTARNPDRIAAMQQFFGSDLTTDIRSATLYGPDSQEMNVTSLIAGNFNRDKLISLVKLSSSYAEIPYKGHTLYSWVDDKNKKAQVGTFAGENLIAISPSQKTLEQAIDVLEGRQPSLAGKTQPLTSLKGPAGSFMFAAAEGPSELAGQSHAAILKNSSLLMLAASEQAGNLKVHLQIESDTDESAVQIENFVRGMLALAALKVQDQPELGALVQAGQVSRTGRSLAFDFGIPSQKLFDLIKSHISLDLPFNGGHNGVSAQKAEAAQIP